MIKMIQITITEEQQRELLACISIAAAICAKIYGGIEMDKEDTDIIKYLANDEGIKLVKLGLLVNLDKVK